MNLHQRIENYTKEEIGQVINTEKLFNAICNYLNSLIEFCNNNNIELNDYIDIQFYDTIVECIKYIYIDLSKHDYDFYLDGIVDYYEFINNLKQKKYNMVKLDNNNVLLKVNNNILRKE